MIGAEVTGAEEPTRPGKPAGVRNLPVGLRFKLLYGSGALVDGIITAALTYFLLFYLTAVCGLPGSFAGTALLIGLLIDALVEPAVGLLSDNTSSRMGRRLPYLLYGTLPVAVVFALLFSIPASMGHAPLLVYATICSMAVRIGQSVFNIPYVAVGAEVSDDYAERSSITSYRVCFSMLGIFLAIGLGLGVFMSGSSGLLNRQAYVPFGWTCAALIAVGGFGGALATRGVLPRLHVSNRAAEPVLQTFLFEIRDILRNRSFVVLFLAVLAFLVGQGMAAALAIYLYRYFWDLSTATVQLVLIATTLGPFVGAPLTTLLGRRIEKKPLAIANLCIFVLCQFWPPLARIAGFLPGNGTTIITILTLNALVAGAALIGGTIGAQSMMADATDEHEFLFGVRREGLFFSGLTLAAKAATGLGGFIAGVTLDLIHFPTAIPAKSADLHLPPDVVRDLGLIPNPRRADSEGLPAAIRNDSS